MAIYMKSLYPKENEMRSPSRALFKKSLLASSILLACIPAAFAQTEEPEMIEVVGSIAKTGTVKFYDTQSTEVINSQQISEKKTEKVDDALSYTAGVFTGMYGHDSRSNWLKIRGLDASYTIDGMPELTYGYFGNTVETYGLERIEVLKGASSQLYGSTKPGGTINLVTKRPLDKPAGELTVSAGNNNQFGVGGDYSGVLTDDNSARYRVVGQYRDADGQQRHTGLEHYYFAPSLTWDISDKTSLTLLASFQQDEGTPENGFFPAYGTLINTTYGKIDRKTYYGEPDFDDLDRKTESVGYEIKHEFDNGIIFTQNYKYAHQELDLAGVYGSYTDLDRTYTRNSYRQRGTNITHTIDNRLSKTFELGDWRDTFLVGADYLKNSMTGEDYNNYGDSTADLFNPQYGYSVIDNFQPFQLRANELGLYAQNQLVYDNKLILNQGIRHSRIKNHGYWTGSDFSRDYSHNTYNAGVMYIFDNNLAPYVNYSESFLPVYGYNASEKTVYRPYEAKQWEGGIKYSPDGFPGQFSIAYFDIKAQNSFASNGSGQATQTLETRSKGIEFEAKADVTENIDLAFTYTYTDSETDQSTTLTTRTPLIARHTASIWSNYNFRSGLFDGLTVGTGIRYTGKTVDQVYYPDDDVSGYALWDALVKYQINKTWALQVNATNLTNKEYVAGCSYWCYYGAERSVIGTVTMKW